MRQPSVAKITQPDAVGAFPRLRLFRLIDRKLNHLILWVTGPPGSGKTTLISSYLAVFGYPCIWYQLDASDQDIASFFFYMELAVKKVAPQKRQPLPLLTPEYLKDFSTFTRRYFERLYNQLLSRSAGTSARFIIVFDNYQEIPEGSRFHDTIQEGLTGIPDGINVILISRWGPPGIYDRMRANRTMEIIDWDELKFSFDESKKLIRHRGHRRLSNELLRKLHEKAGGWAAGLVLLTEGIRVGGVGTLFSRTDMTDKIFRYFAGEIFNQMDMETQNFLIKTSFLKQMTPPMAEALTGVSQAKAILSNLSQKHYFTHRYESQAVFYQYHPLFREFLQIQARKNFGPEDLLAIERRASMILADHGQMEEAVNLMVKSENWPALIPMILNHAPSLISQGRNQTLDAWIKALPSSQVNENPWLLYWIGVSRLPFSPLESSHFFEEAFNLFREKKDPTGIYLSLAGLFDSTTFGMDNFTGYDRWIELLVQIRKEYETYPSEEIEARLTASVTYALAARRPKRPNFEKWAGRALSLAEKCPDLSLKIRTLQALATHYIFIGDFIKAFPILHSLQQVVQSPHLPPLLTILIKTIEALYYWSSGFFAECREAVNQGLDLAASTGVHLWDPFLLGHGAARALSEGDVSGAREFLKKLYLSLNLLPAWGKEYYHVLEAWFSLTQGELSSALSHIEWSLAFTNETGNLPSKPFAHLGKALILIELGREKEARNQINQVRTLLKSFKAPLVEFMFLMAQARLEMDMRNETSGLELLRRALALGKEQGYSNTFFWHATMMANLLKRALDAGIEVDYVQGLIRKRRLFPGFPPYDCDRWPWPMKIITLGTFELVKEGEPLEFPGKAPRKMLLFLKALIASGSKGWSEEQLTATLWPEADGDMAHQAFATSLHRLRLLLGNEKAIHLRKGLLKFDERFCYVDAHAFEYLLQQADALNDMALLQKAIALYAGPFLGGDDSEPWAISYQEKLRSKFLRAVTKLGQFFENKGDQEKAIVCYQKGLEVDDFAEEFCQRLMLCYDASGRKAEALSLYDRFCRRLRSFLGIDPSQKTQAIYENLRRKV